MIETISLTQLPSKEFVGKNLLILQDDNKVGFQWNKNKKRYEKWYAKLHPLNLNIELEQNFVHFGKIAQNLNLTDPSIALVNQNVRGLNNIFGFIKGWEPTDKLYVDAMVEAKETLSSEVDNVSLKSYQGNAYSYFHMFGFI